MRAVIYYKQNHDGNHYTVVMRGAPKSSIINGLGIQIWEPIENATVFNAQISQRHHFPVGDRTLGRRCPNPPRQMLEIAKRFEKSVCNL